MALAICAAGCSPYVMSYKHLIFDAADGLEVLEASSKSPDTQGVELLRPKVRMPLKVRLSRPSYTLLFDTPLQISPLVFISARDGQGQPLLISGAHVRRVYPGSAAELDGFEFSFYVREADGESLSIEISNSSGRVLGSELLPYEVVSRGYSYGIEGV
jgi:hypothetical protein